jgi:uncharacterized protein (DUF433 family)
MSERIECDQAICSGKPVIKGTRIMVRNIIGMLAGGSGYPDILAAYPELTEEDVTAAVDYAKRHLDDRSSP